MKRIINVLVVMGMLFSLTFLQACGNSSGNNAKPSSDATPANQSGATTKDAGNDATYTLNIGMVVSDEDPMYLGAEQFKKQVEEKTKGKIKIEIYSNSKLGDTSALVKNVKEGKNVAIIVDPGLLSETVPQIAILNAPYLFDNYDEGKKIVTSPKWKSLEDELAAKGKIKILSFNWYQGERNLLTNKPIKTIGDVAGLKLRTPGAPVWKGTVTAMGGVPVADGWSAVYSLVKDAKIDGAEAQTIASYSAKLQEVTKYITKTNHIQLVTGLAVSSTWFEKLPKEYQQIVIDEAFKAGDFASQRTIALAKDYEDKMKAAGVTISDIDVAPFKKATEKVYEDLKFTDLRKEFNTVIGK